MQNQEKNAWCYKPGFMSSYNTAFLKVELQ